MTTTVPKNMQTQHEKKWGKDHPDTPYYVTGINPETAGKNIKPMSELTKK